MSSIAFATLSLCVRSHATYSESPNRGAVCLTSRPIVRWAADSARTIREPMRPSLPVTRMSGRWSPSTSAETIVESSARSRFEIRGTISSSRFSNPFSIVTASADMLGRAGHLSFGSIGLFAARSASSSESNSCRCGHSPFCQARHFPPPTSTISHSVPFQQFLGLQLRGVGGVLVVLPLSRRRYRRRRCGVIAPGGRNLSAAGMLLQVVLGCV